jgi:hypothetical protein
MTLCEALSRIPDPRARNRQYPLWGLLALIPVASLSGVDSLRGVERFARANPHHPTSACASPRATPSSPSSPTAWTRRGSRRPSSRSFPGRTWGRSWCTSGEAARKSPQVRLVEVLALHLLTTLAQAKAEGREDQALLELLDRLGAEGLKGKVVPKGGRTSWS